MGGNLRDTQIEVNQYFACHALEGFCASCNFATMQVRLEMIRAARGETLEGIAAKLDVSTSTVQRWERHAMNIPSKRLPAIADAYGCQVGDIFLDESATPRFFPEAGAKVPTEDELTSMVATAQAELPAGVSLGDYPSAVASSLQAQLRRYSGERPNVDENASATSKRRDEAAPPRTPTKRSAQG